MKYLAKLQIITQLGYCYWHSQVYRIVPSRLFTVIPTSASFLIPQLQATSLSCPDHIILLFQECCTSELILNLLGLTFFHPANPGVHSAFIAEVMAWCTSLFNDSSIEGHVSFFQFIGIRNKAAINLCEQVSFCVNVSLPFSGIKAQESNCWVIC